MSHEDRLYLRGRVWWCWFYDARGKRYQKTTRQRDKRAALRVLRQYEREAADPRIAAAKALTFEDAIVDWLRDAEHVRNVKPASLSYYRDKVAALGGVIGLDTPLIEVDYDRVANLIAVRLEEVSRHTVGKELTVLRGILKLARRRKRYPFPLDEVLPDRFDRQYKPRTNDHHTLDEARALISVLPPHRAAHVAYLYATADDWTPSLSALKSNFDWQRMLIRVYGTKSENRTREVPILDHTEWFARFAYEGAAETGPAYQPWRNARRDMALACKKAGIRHATPRTCRHSFGQWLRERGAHTSAIGAAMGHVDGRMAERVYTELAGDKLREVLKHQLKKTTE